ncbi:MAG TPA: DUF1592 domain-containing protein [Polyangiaceae bacterium]|nr:DUF1592 domain-containing protein [Polyangiaceae bacterium]
MIDRREALVSGLVAACLTLATGCANSISDNPATGGQNGAGMGATNPGGASATGGSTNGGATNGGATTSGGSSNAGASATGGSGANAGTSSTTGGSPGGASACTGTDAVAPKRLVRLTFNQVANSIRTWFGNALADQISSTYEIGDPTSRTFPPLASPREGSVVTDATWAKLDLISQAVGKYVFDNFSTVTSCGASPTDACAQMYLQTLGTKVFRRPLASAEVTRINSLYSAMKSVGGTVNEGVQHGVYALLQSPEFLYRQEFGTNATQEGPLTAYELASQLSYFLTDGPPDQALLDAAAQNKLSTKEELSAQATRLLATDAAKKNLQSAMFAYFSLPGLDTVVIDPTKTTFQFTDGVRNAMYNEATLFINNTLWNGKVVDLMTSRKSSINPNLAQLYGVTFPTTNVGTDGFATVTLPENRAGLLTMAGFLTARARTDNQSVVGRGLLVNASIVCAENPEFPAGLADMINSINQMQAAANLSEREKANYRATNGPCSGCHPKFDPFGLTLENYDVIGKYQTEDASKRPIDPAVTLPEAAGGLMVKNAVDMAQKLAASGAFETCMAKNLIAYALAEGAQVTPQSCSTRAVATAYAGGDKTFSSLVMNVASSKVFSVRAAGGTQ